MKGFFKVDKILYINISLFVIAFIKMYEFIWSNGLAGKLMFGLYIVVVALALFIGTIIGLIASLLLIFTMGSLILYLSYENVLIGGFSTDLLTMELSLIYGIGLLLTVLIGGFINEQMTRIVAERNKLQQQVKQFIAIDPYTSFDNIHRMEVEIQREINRINRYGGKLTLLFLELDNYYEFSKIYGFKEEEHLLKSIGMKVNDSLRISDRKFRYSDRKFAFLLIETSKEYVEVVIEKLNQNLCDHELLSGKTVTLSFHISYEEYNEDKQDTSPLEFIKEVERETVFYAM